MRERLSLPFEQWPARWRELWSAATGLGAGFDEDGRGAHWAAATKTELRKRLGRFAGFLSRRDALSGLPADHLAPEVLNAYVAELRGRELRPATILGCLRDLHEAVRAMQPGADLRYIQAARRRLHREACRAVARERPFVEPIALYRAGIARMNRVSLQKYEKADVKAVQYGDGLLMAIAACSLDRLRNLSAIELGRNLVANGPRYTLQFEPHETNGRKRHVCDLPSRLSPFIDEYLAAHRAQLLQDRSSNLLFLSCHRRPLPAGTMSWRFRTAALEELGVPLTPHSVRGLAVTDLVEKHPELIDMAPDLLHHSSPETTRKHYIRARQIVANRQYLATYEAVRRRALDQLGTGELFRADGKG